VSTPPEPEERRPGDLVKALGAIQRAQTVWLVDLGQVAQGDPSFIAAFRRWQEQLTSLKLFLHRAESRLLHYVVSDDRHEPWKEFAAPGPNAGDRRAIAGRWTDKLVDYFRTIHIDTRYRRLTSTIDLDEECATADIVTDFVAVAEVCETTMPALSSLQQQSEPACLEDLAFYHVISPWKQRGVPALLDVLRWLAEILREHDEL
jgi:hypothetical protein